MQADKDFKVLVRKHIRKIEIDALRDKYRE